MCGHEFIISGGNRGGNFIFKFHFEGLARGVIIFRMYFSYFRNICSMKFFETSYNMAPTDDNALLFYQLEAT